MNHFPALAIGCLIGFSACAPLNAAINGFERSRCTDSNTHQLVSVRGFFGTETRCVDRRYL
jgi:hypothetical protein